MSTVTDLDELRRQAGELLAPVVDLRRLIHARPELGLDLPRTQEMILDALDGLEVQVTTGTATTSVIAVIEGDSPGPTTLLRGDMDALPMPEDTDLPYASAVDGVMHACGHDAHVAMLVGAARLLAGRRDRLAGRVICMFQPGEEGFGGARVMLDEGLLEAVGPVDRAFAIHVSSILPLGWVTGRGGALMASADGFRVVITGKGGHASMPHDAVDPVPVACEIVTALQSMVTRRISAFDPAVITVASIQAGTTVNVVPETATLEITVRAVSDHSRQLAVEGMRRVVDHVAAAHLCAATIEEPHPGYPVTINDEAAAGHSLAIARSLFGPERVHPMPTPVMAAEDWSFVLQRIPGSMLFLGVAPPGVDAPAPNHSNRMLVDEPAMAAGIALHAAVALSSSRPDHG